MPDRVSVYRSDWAMLVYFLSPLPLLGLAALSVVAATNGQLALAAFLAFAATFNAYRIGWRAAYELRVEGDDVLWRAPLASGLVRRSSVLTFRTATLQLDITVLMRRGGRDVWVWKGSGLKAFLTTAVFRTDTNA